MLEFEDKLKSVLVKLEAIEDEMDILSNQKSEIRDSINKFLHMHNLTEHHTTSDSGKLWKMAFESQTPRRSIGDWDLLQSIITPDQFASVIRITEMDPKLTVRQVKKISKKKPSDNHKPTSPVASI